MSTTVKKLINIPVSISILHKHEYKNLYMMLIIKNKSSKRRAFSEKNCDSSNDIIDEIDYTYQSRNSGHSPQVRRNTLKK
jgi:hypothetical protein